MEKFEIEIEGTSPFIMNKGSKKDAKDILTYPDQQQAEARAYRLEKGNLAVPSSWLKGCFRDYYARSAPIKKKGEYHDYISPRISVQPFLIDLNITEYEIRKTRILVKQRGKVVDIITPAQPMINLPWKLKFILISTMDRHISEIQKLVTNAGELEGFGSNRINGYGRFQVTQFQVFD